MKQVLLAVAVATVVTACATSTSPTGRKQYVGAVSQEQLDQMGAQAFAEAKAKQKVSNDARMNAYVRCVVNDITRELPQGWQTNWEVAVFEDSSANAFALPGGKVGVNTGIFTVAKNPDQLAAVIGHEIGHVVSRHHDERITKQQGTSTLLGIGSAILGSAYGSGAANAAGQIGGAAAQTFYLLPNSRTQESEADVVGQELAAKAGFDPRQAVNLWQNMAAAGGERAPTWLSTHPDPASRIGELSARAGSLMPVYEQARASGHTPKCG
ncbi:M48 family metallopeptidase [Lysobacter sp. S4-A87]|uniref:M48 family metallopeptidase n=1 Tax=Lysobacter sp. S4-A87 TaxID=2925843 RepID=UPI001F53364B|nr:M48 family metallopeptidase [Lysobacter sp. S4-A87]UNK48256.1 M48 family metallopeptidase [Lysobacter sp. S4-A87]